MRRDRVIMASRSKQLSQPVQRSVSELSVQRRVSQSSYRPKRNTKRLEIPDDSEFILGGGEFRKRKKTVVADERDESERVLGSVVHDVLSFDMEF